MPTALVTGATAGIGLSFATHLADEGYSLVLVARDADRLASTADELRASYGVSVEVLAADLTDRAALARVEERVASTTEPIDLLVNNAGFGLKDRFANNSADLEAGMLDVLVTAVLRLSHAAITSMLARPQVDGPADFPRGVINVSSVAAFLPRGTYSAAKAWVNSFSEWAHNEYADQGIAVMALCPGFTRTEFHQRMGLGPNSAPKMLWLNVDNLVAEGLEDYRKRKPISIPSARYKTIVRVTKIVPKPVLQRLQSLGRK